MWQRVSSRLRDDPHELAKRRARQQRITVRAPLRPLCLCLRASDTRLSAMNCLVQPRAGDALGLDEDSDSLIPSRRAHKLVIPGEAIRALMKPVTILWPGEDWKQVARKCGVTKHYLSSWMRTGQVRILRYESARLHGGRGKPVAIVYTPSPIDPNAFRAAPPDSMWGTMWRDLHERVPNDFEQIADRVPRYRKLKGRDVFRGWTWKCPGRVDSNEKHRSCGRNCNRLFCPLPPWTVPEAIGDPMPLPCHENRILRSFACKQCWGVRDITLIGPDGWNLFVTHLTGGLLYGHEVERPRDEVPQSRRRNYSKQRVRSTPRRDEVERLLLDGLSYRQIADRMGVKYCTTFGTARRIYRKCGVATRAEFVLMKTEESSRPQEE